MNLILLDDDDSIAAGLVTVDGVRASHLLTVLKVAPGHTVRLGLIEGPLGVGTVAATAEGRVTMRCVFDAAVPPRPRVDLLLALPRPKVLRRLWAQLAALGVGQIILTNAERVERHYFDSHILAEATFRPLLIEGLQQARDTRLPVVTIHRQFRILVEDHLDRLVGEGVRLVAEPGAPRSVGTALSADSPGRVLLAVGPEGGWNRFELDLLQAHGFQQVGAGRRTLRVDTACTALLAIVHAALEENR